MTKGQFWQSASNWGFLGGAAFFAVNLIGWGLRLESSASSSWIYELMLFVAGMALIIYTGRRNARASASAGYTYGQAVGFVFAMMMFAGVVYGVGRFLLVNFIAREYYDALNAAQLDSMLTIYQNTPQYDAVLDMSGRMVRWFSNPFFLIFGSVVNFVIKGGFLGLVLCAFVTRKPDFFAAHGAMEDERRSE